MKKPLVLEVKNEAIALSPMRFFTSPTGVGKTGLVYFYRYAKYFTGNKHMH